MLPITSNHDAAVPAGTNVPVKNQQSCWSVGCHAHLVGEPDAANPHVRFDERGVETEQGGLLGHRQPKGPATRKALPKPPRHSSTLLTSWHCLRRVGRVFETHREGRDAPRWVSKTRPTLPNFRNSKRCSGFRCCQKKCACSSKVGLL